VEGQPPNSERVQQPKQRAEDHESQTNYTTFLTTFKSFNKVQQSFQNIYWKTKALIKLKKS
jgi:hypothetical protein